VASKFRGIVPPIVTPLTAEGEVNERAYRRLVDYFLEAGVHGFWVCGAAGEGFVLDDEERIRIAEFSADQVKGRAKVIMHVGAPSTRSAVRIAKGAAAAGVDAIASVPPYPYRPDDDGTVAYYRALSDAADLPLFVYNLPGVTGVEVSAGLMERLVKQVPHLAGVKHSAANFGNVHAFSSLGIAVFTGHSGLLVPALTMGAVGAIGSPLNIAPRLHMDIYDAFMEGNLAKAEDLQRKAATLHPFCFRYSHIALYKAVLSQRLGIDMGQPRPPIRPLTEEQRRQVIKQAEELGAR
jgi:dihydrodipicolinate synthase/N-acetylneuraminate lyase